MLEVKYLKYLFVWFVMLVSVSEEASAYSKTVFSCTDGAKKSSGEVYFAADLEGYTLKKSGKEFKVEEFAVSPNDKGEWVVTIFNSKEDAVEKMVFSEETHQLSIQDLTSNPKTIKPKKCAFSVQEKADE